MKLNRDVYSLECPWLTEPLLEGMEVYKYNGYTYGCITDTGIAVTEIEGETPFFEVPRDAVE